MMKLKRILALSLSALLLSGCAVSATELPTVTEPAQVVATAYFDALPESWQDGATPEAEFLLGLTAGTLYTVSEAGEILPQLAEAVPADVTAEYAGQFGVAADAVRGYAFRIDLDPAAAWEDGAPITARDYYAALEDLVNRDADPLGLAGAAAYRQGLPLESGEILSLEEAGFASVSEAEDAGVRELYVDMSGFWGLGAGWKPVTDQIRIRDYAMPSGITEQYVTPAYIYQNYLAEGKTLEAFQKEAVGVCADRTQPRTMADVGMQVSGEHQLTLILEEPATAAALALKLGGIVLENGGLSSGPYRVAETSDTQIRLERNPNWCGEVAEDAADVIVCKKAD